MAALVATALLVVCGHPAAGQELPLRLSLPLHVQLDVDPPAETATEERLAFLEERLEAAEFQGDLWQYGWLSVHSTGLVYNAVDASLTDDDDDRVARIVGATKSAVGIGSLLLRPLPARLGADPIRALPGGTPELERARLQAAEELLEDSARRARRKYTVWPHLESALVNFVGGGIILAFGEWEDAAVSTGVGLAVGELQIWTVPDRPAADLAAYRARFGPAGARETGWYLVPRPNGLALAYRF